MPKLFTLVGDADKMTALGSNKTGTIKVDVAAYKTMGEGAEAEDTLMGAGSKFSVSSSELTAVYQATITGLDLELKDPVTNAAVDTLYLTADGAKEGYGKGKAATLTATLEGIPGESKVAYVGIHWKGAKKIKVLMPRLSV